MRVARAPPKSLEGKRVVAARYSRIVRSPNDEGFECPGCRFVFVVTQTVASDPLAAFRCPMCGEHCIKEG